MSNQDSSIQYQSKMGAVGEAALGLAKFNFSVSTLEMLKGSADHGHYVPWTRLGPKGEGLIAGAGNHFKVWGKGGLGNMPRSANHLTAAATYRKKAGFFSLRHSAALKEATADIMASNAGRAVGDQIGMAAARKVAEGAAASVVVSRVAGVALRLGWIGTGVSAGYGLAKWAYNSASSLVSQYRGLELGGYFPETQTSMTSRQRNLQAITSSNLQARSAIGNEAMLFHR